MSNSLLFNAIRNNDTKAVERLLEQGADPNAKNVLGNTPLFTAAVRKDTKIVEPLFKYGANPNAKNEYGYTALYRVIDEEIETLFNHEYGITALYHVIYEKETLFNHESDPNTRNGVSTAEIVELLLQHGADLSYTSVLGHSILHIIINEKMFDVAEILIKYGADVNAEDSDGYTPLDSVCCVNKYGKLCDLLVSHGARSTKESNFLYLAGASPNYHNKDTLVSDLEYLLDQEYLNLNLPDPELQELIAERLTPRLHTISDSSDLSMTVSSLVLRTLSAFSPFLIG